MKLRWPVTLGLALGTFGGLAAGACSSSSEGPQVVDAATPDTEPPAADVAALDAAGADAAPDERDGADSSKAPMPEAGPRPGPSCAGGLTCQGKSCCESVVVPGGAFPMGRSMAGTDACPPATTCLSSEQPEHTVALSSFALDTFEVTVGRFRRFVDTYMGPPAAGAGAHPLIAGTGWDATWDARMPSNAAALRSNLKCSPLETWSDAPAGMENRPISCVSWYEAFAFCAWDGGWLPTEAEWEYAATGGDQNRLYPWGSAAPTPARAAYECSFDGAQFCQATDIPPVGSAPTGSGRWGHQDLAGSMWEWTYDAHAIAWYSEGGAVCTNCANTARGSDRVIRGGGYDDGAENLRVTYRTSTAAGSSERDGLGFRCARTP